MFNNILFLLHRFIKSFIKLLLLYLLLRKPTVFIGRNTVARKKNEKPKRYALLRTFQQTKENKRKENNRNPSYYIYI